MARQDLLALADEDLVSLSNRGTLKRARRELESDALQHEIVESEDLVISWSDGVTCTFPAGKTIHDAICSSGVEGISRHIIRSVLAYQSWVGQPAEDDETQRGESEAGSAEDQTQAVSATNELHSAKSWDPGKLSDEDLIGHYRRAAVTRAKKQFQQGVLVELTRGKKPTARFLHQHCTIRFPVPGDLRYVRGDCVESALPTWTCMAVWAFREMPDERKVGLLSLGQEDADVPRTQLDSLLPLLNQWSREGFANLPEAWCSRWKRAEKAVRKAGLVWPAELMDEIAAQYTSYCEGDARFSPTWTLRLLGELIARIRAITNPKPSLPQTLVRGNLGDVATELRQGRLVGLGLEIFPGESQDVIAAYFQDSESGAAAVIRRTNTQSNKDAPLPFERIALQPLARSTSIGAASMSQLMIAKGKRSPNDELSLPRGSGNLSMNPQSFQWEHLLPPILMDDFDACRQRLETLPPDFLRPRRLTENVHVFPIRRLENVAFDSVRQVLCAEVRDEHGQKGYLETPYYFRGSVTLADFHEALSNFAAAARFISGRVSLVQGEMVIQPLAIVFEKNEERFAACPHLLTRELDPQENPSEEIVHSTETDPIRVFLAELQTGLSEVLLTGLAETNEALLHELGRNANNLGFTRIGELLEQTCSDLQRRLLDRNWTPKSSQQTLRELVLLCRIADS
ncbi:MAG: hypothetical protein AAF483_08070 [Planctomycetota bacterium]